VQQSIVQQREGQAAMHAFAVDGGVILPPVFFAF
jgi:hypothetical protein